MWDQTIESLLSILHQRKELPTNAGEGDFDRKMKHASVRCLWLAVACYPLLGLVAFAISQSARRPPALIELGLGVALFQIILALLSLVLEIIPSAVSLSRFDTYAYKIRKMELEHDMRGAEQLLQFDLAALQFADKWLSLRIERMKLRMGIFVGGSDKVAIFALAGTGWTAWHNLPTFGSSWRDNVYLYPLAFLAGLAIGGMCINSLIKKLSYQRDLLTIAIQRKSTE
jgi:hypothetical protein